MAFGPIIKLKTDTGLQLELAPFSREEVVQFAEGFQKETVTQYLAMRPVQTMETEQEWYDGFIRNPKSLVWGIWSVDLESRRLIGNASLTDITGEVIIQAVNGIAITDSQYWGRGIASAVQKTLVWYGFQRRAIARIKSAVLQPNTGSRKALERAGYSFVYTERNEKFVASRFIHKDCFECLNPADWAWRLWWGDDRPTRKSIEARAKTLEGLQWAEKNVELL